ncbi:hypothetical protein LAZ67_23001545 [Cordylochernes scorpioides]|uniref:Integrase p58-like C-terminal domain-containing protein n=1 Tax=Cordylochernes scorpioides TaxID=51811 RepID=A0ABY6LQS8_9ARAC|nr:hypothetical protein LAZ67_23001545 [Cordylochernes scorpioides]
MGDLVLLAVPKGKGSSKFSAKFYGHFRVVAKVSEVNFRMRGVNMHDEQVVHIDRMKAFRSMRNRKPAAAKRECYPRRRMIPLAREGGSACRISPRREMSTPPLENTTVPDQENGYSHDEPTVIYVDPTLEDRDKYQYLVQSMSPGTRASKLADSYPLTAENYLKPELLQQVYVGDLIHPMIDCSSKQQLKVTSFYDDMNEETWLNVSNNDKIPVCHNFTAQSGLTQNISPQSKPIEYFYLFFTT